MKRKLLSGQFVVLYQSALRPTGKPRSGPPYCFDKVYRDCGNDDCYLVFGDGSVYHYFAPAAGDARELTVADIHGAFFNSFLRRPTAEDAPFERWLAAIPASAVLIYSYPPYPGTDPGACVLAVVTLASNGDGTCTATFGIPMGALDMYSYERHNPLSPWLSTGIQSAPPNPFLFGNFAPNYQAMVQVVDPATGTILGTSNIVDIIPNTLTAPVFSVDAGYNWTFTGFPNSGPWEVFVFYEITPGSGLIPGGSIGFFYNGVPQFGGFSNLYFVAQYLRPWDGQYSPLSNEVYS